MNTTYTSLAEIKLILFAYSPSENLKNNGLSKNFRGSSVARLAATLSGPALLLLIFRRKCFVVNYGSLFPGGEQNEIRKTSMEIHCYSSLL